MKADRSLFVLIKRKQKTMSERKPPFEWGIRCCLESVVSYDGHDDLKSEKIYFMCVST